MRILCTFYKNEKFFHNQTNIYKIGVTGAIHNRIGAYPKGSRIYCILPVEGDPEITCLHKFREEFISRLDIGREYFQGDITKMIKTLYIML